MAGRRLLLVVGGSIAAYKACHLARSLVSAGAEVRVLMTSSASSFVQPLSFEYITHQAVLRNRFEGEDGANVDHIGLARWPDLIVAAPLSANRISLFALGIADDLLGACALATEAPMLLAPAMNHQMWRQGIVQEHLDSLRKRGWRVAEPGSGEQACGETGPGRMMEVDGLMAIIEEILGQLPASTEGGRRRADPPEPLPHRPSVPLRCLMTMGATIEDIDPVRFLSNRSSGKMGLALFESLSSLGFDTQVVCADISAEVAWRRHGLGEEGRFVDVRSAEEMLEAVMQRIADRKPDVFVGAAAVSDYRPQKPSSGKIASGKPSLSLELCANPDIIAQVKSQFPDIYCVAFAAQTEALAENARAKLHSKQVDMIVANPVGATGPDSIGGDSVSGIILRPDGERPFDSMSKLAFSSVLAEELYERLRRRRAKEGPTPWLTPPP